MYSSRFVRERIEDLGNPKKSPTYFSSFENASKRPLNEILPKRPRLVGQKVDAETFRMQPKLSEHFSEVVSNVHRILPQISFLLLFFTKI